jgi:ABC-2 type transport system permease protein
MSPDSTTTGARATAGTSAPDAPRLPLRASLRLLRSELGLVFGRRRNQVLLVVLALVPVLIGVAIRVSSGSPEPGEGPPLLDRVSQNGLFLAFTGLAVVVPFLLPLTVGVVAGEAAGGTLRYLLVAPVTRLRLLVVKYAALVVFAAAAALTVAGTGILIGWVLFPVGDVVLLSGTTVSAAQAVGRALLVAAYVTASLAALAAVGLAVSTATEVPVGAMAATVGFATLSQVLGVVPQLDWLHPVLLTRHWLAFGDLLRDPVALDAVREGLLLAAAWGGVALTLAWARLVTKDVTS